MERYTLKNKTLWGTIDRFIELENYEFADFVRHGICHIFLNMYGNILRNGDSNCSALLHKYTNELYVQFEFKKTLSDKNDVEDLVDFIKITKSYHSVGNIYNNIVIMINKKMLTETII